jgi:hypothetical protein
MHYCRLLVLLFSCKGDDNNVHCCIFFFCSCVTKKMMHIIIVFFFCSFTMKRMRIIPSFSSFSYCRFASVKRTTSSTHHPFLLFCKCEKMMMSSTTTGCCSGVVLQVQKNDNEQLHYSLSLLGCFRDMRMMTNNNFGCWCFFCFVIDYFIYVVILCCLCLC